MSEFSGWESPVNIISSQMNMQMEGEILKAIRNVGIIVDKEELIKALNYDRGQYSKGFENGYNKAIDDCKELTFREVVYCDSLNDRTEFRELAEQLKEGGNDE